MRRDKRYRPWHLYVLGLLAVAVTALAILEIGPPSSSARTSREVVTAEDGVVQSSVSASGNIAAGADVDVNFKTSGTLQNVYVSVGQHVTQGQLLATLDPTAAQLQLDQAEASLTAAEDQLTALQNGTASSSSAADPSSGSSTSDTSYTGGSGSAEFVSDTTRKDAGPPGADSPTTTTITTITTISSGSGTTRPSSTTTQSGSSHSGSAPSGSGSSGGSGGSGGSGASSGSSHSGSTSTTTTPSPASIASAESSVYAAEANVRTAQAAVDNTKLYAPISGTIASLASLVPGDSVSGGSSSSASNSSSSSSSSSTGASSASAGASTTAGGLGGSSSSSSSSSGSGSFAEIVNTSSMTMTVAVSESDIVKVKVGQPATVTLDALPDVELAAHVAQISPVGTTSGGVVSYNATINLDQTDSQIRPGMSASATVIVDQAQGVTVPNEAVTGSGSLGTVSLLRDGKTVQQEVVVGLRGDSRTQIISGVNAGQQLVVTVALPSLNSSTTSTTGSTGTLGGGRFGGGGGLFGGGAGLFGGGGGGAFFRGAAGGG